MYATRYAIPYALDTDRPMRLESRVVYSRREAETRLPAIDEPPGILSAPEPHTARLAAHNGNPINVQPVPRRRRVLGESCQAVESLLVATRKVDRLRQSGALSPGTSAAISTAYDAGSSKFCLDCPKEIRSTSPNAQRCPECSKAHTRKLQMEWMRKKRGKA